LRLRPGTFAVEVTRSGTVLGRHSSADVRLPLPDVSRQHCRFVCESGCWQVIDLDSLNGIFVNGQPVRQAELHDRDQLRIGGFIFEVDLRGDSGAEGPGNAVRTIANALPFPDDGQLRRAS
jgi:pSer/pThr/pTyr-binding forkhead associated (FHA) protein